MQAKIKIHSIYKHLFNQSEFTADLTKYADIPLYLGSMHPKFKIYVDAIHRGECQEGYALLDKNLKVITDQDLFIKSVKQDDEFYLVPGIVGGGGKRSGKLIQYAVIAAAAFIGGSAIIGALSTGGTGAAVGSAAVGAATATGGTAAAASGVFLGISASTLAINAGLALVTAMFTKRPELQGGGKDAAIRQNNMFGGLRNTIESGTSVPLIYGMHRMTGQLISGYLDTVDHGKDDEITVQSRFTT